MGSPDQPLSDALQAGLVPPPDGWRAETAPIQVLPAFPLVLHRGGFPDGS